jgi:cytoskeletal protein CcmA (bactofilin family)
MFGKGKSAGGCWKGQPPQQLALARATTALQPLQTTSSLSSDMTVVGKIVCKGVLKIYGLVEGEVSASKALIADGARIQGDIVAEELTVAGRVEGNIYSLRVKLQSIAVVEGDIYHRSLSMDEHARFEGCSWPENNPPEPRSYIEAESLNHPQPQALIAFADKGQFRGKTNEEERNHVGGKGMPVFLAACIAIIAIGVMSHFALSALQQPTGLAYTSDGVRIDPGWIEPSTRP